MPKQFTFLLFLLFVALSTTGLAQADCGSDVPYFLVDLRGNPDSVYTTPDIERNGKCCDAAKNAPCVVFEIYLDPNAQAIAFDVCDGAKPSGALFYQIDCGVETPVGDPICLVGEGPFFLTFCKPGKNDNVFCIRSLPRPTVSPDRDVQEGCSTTFSADGYSDENITWTSIFPGNEGDYDYLLNCTFQCSEVSFTAEGVLPDFIDYTVCGFNSGGCDPLFVCDTVRVNIKDGPVIAIEEGDMVLCTEDDRVPITANISGGEPPYNIMWSTGENTNTILVGGGTYTVTVTDAANCIPVERSITIAPANPMSLIFDVNPVLCFGDNSGSITALVSGGNPDLEYQWNDDQNQTGNTASNLSAGVYTLTVTDALGCQISDSVEIPGPANPLDLEINAIQNVSCKGAEDGSISFSASGGTRPYTYQLNSDGSTTDTISTGLAAGVYTVEVTDANGCKQVLSVTITEPEFSLSLTENISSVLCFGEATGRVVLSGFGGTSPYRFSADGQNYGLDSIFSNLSAGSYTFFIRDDNGCEEQVTLEITQPEFALDLLLSPFNPSCFARSDGRVESQVSGGTAPYTYTWSDGTSQENLSGLMAGTYTLTVEDANGCQINSSVSLTNPPEINLVLSSTNAVCTNSNTGSAEVDIQGGTAPFSILWDDPNTQSTALASNLFAGTYTVVVTDANGCEAMASVEVQNSPTSILPNVVQTIPVQCFGESNGSVIIDIEGGVQPYNYTLIPSSSNAFNESIIPNGRRLEILDIPAGDYTLLIVDNLGCEQQINFTITQPEEALSVTLFSSSPVKCFGEASGSASVVVSGGTEPYDFQWSSGAANNTAQNDNIPAGMHEVLVTDANACSVTLSFVIDSAEPLDLTAVEREAVACFGDNTGSAFATATGGEQPYSYQWNDAFNQNTDTAFFLAAGSYTVIVTDENACKDSATVAITQPNNPLSLQMVTQTNVACFGETNGAATVLANGGTAPYRFLWNDPDQQNTATASNLAVGNYTCVVTDANGCSKSLSVIITGPTRGLGINLDILSNVSCFGLNDGSALATASGGMAPYTFVYSPNGTTNPQANNLSAGLYRVTVTDANGCSNFVDFEITEPEAALTVSTEALENVSCKGFLDGVAQAFGDGGTLPYSFSWDDPNNQSSDVAASLAAGFYTVTLSDANGCEASDEVEIKEPDAPLTLSLLVNAVKCFNGSDGEATVLTNGGTAPFSYNWNDPLNQKTSIAKNLRAGTYDVQVTDKNGCSSIATAVITQPSQALALVPDFSNPTCSGMSDGSVSVDISGGTPPYAYQWDDPNNSTTSLVSNLPEGEYEVLVTDANLCVIATSIQISEPNPILLDVSFVEENCDGANNGIISVNVEGGTEPYSFNWDDANGTTSATAQGLSPGTYTVTVTDANGCSAFTSVSITSEVRIELTLSPEDIRCNGGSDGRIVTTVSGATEPISYLWSDGSNAKNLSNVSAGSYSLTLTDADGCPATASAEIEEPTAFIVNTNQSDVTCFGLSNGSAEVFVNGATSPYAYSWNDINAQSTKRASNLAKGNYVVTITDANACSHEQTFFINGPDPISIALDADDINCFGDENASIRSTVSGGTPNYQYAWNDANNQNTATATNLSAGLYTLQVTDANLCIQSASIEVDGPASRLNLNLSSKNVSCKGLADGAIQSFASGGTEPYTYSWSHDATISSPSLSNLPPGNYTLVLTDFNGCAIQRSVQISEPNNLLDFSISTSNVRCQGESNGGAALSISGGIAPYTIDWKDPINQSTTTVSGLAVGLYAVEVSDKQGCSQIKNFEITQPSEPIVFTLSAENVDCFGNASGSATVSHSSGVAPFSYQWSDPFNQSTQEAQNLLEGIYAVTVTDAFGCTQVDSIEVEGPNQALGLIAQKTNTTCFGENNGSITLNAIGGTAPYMFFLDGNASSQNIDGLSPGTYLLRVTDINGCSVNRPIGILEPNALDAEATVSNVSCFNGGDGKITVNAKGGTLPYSFNWLQDPNETSNTLDSLSPGNVTVIVSDANGCTVQIDTDITQPENPISIAHTTDPVKCFEGSTGSAMAVASGGTAPYTYVWDDPLNQRGSNAINLVAADYVVSVTDANACVAQESIRISQPSPVNIAINNSDVLCFNDDNAFAEAIVSGGTQPYRFLWNDANQQQSARADGLTKGTYLVTVTDANMCQAKATAVVQGPAFPINLGLNIGNIRCKGNADGWAKVNVSGGNAPYQYIWDAPTASNSDSIFNLPSGNYGIKVFDANNCSGQAMFVVAEPEQDLSLTITKENISCFGDSNGSALASVTGGKAPYSYEWNDPQAQMQRRATNLAPGLYQVVVGDANGCFSSEEVDILAPNAPIALDLTKQEPSCFGDDDGGIFVEARNGEAPYVFSWNVGGVGNTNQIVNLKQGQYIVNVSDAKGCAAADTIVLNQPSRLAGFRTETNVNCPGLSNGRVQISATGGVPNYTYTLNQNTQNTSGIFNGLASGLYDIEIRDNNGCAFREEFVITEPKSLQLEVDKNDIACHGDKSGGLRIVVEGGGTPAYSISFNNGAFKDTTIVKATSLEAGTYPYIVRDKNGCSVRNNIVLNQASQIIAQANGGGTFCVGSDVPLNASATGGTPDYQFRWTPNAPSGSMVSVNSDDNQTYFSQVIDANGCKTEPIPVEVFIRNIFNDGLTINAPDTLCFGDAYQIEAVHNADFDPSAYTYNWNPNIGSGTGPFSFTTNYANAKYVLSISDVCGNIIRDSVRVIGIDRPEYILPDTVANGCAPLSILIADTINDNTGQLNYQWFVNGVLSETSNVFLSEFTQPGAYDILVEISTLFGCEVSSENSSKILVNNSPSAFAEVDKTEDILRDANFKFFNTSNGYTDFFWDFGDGDTSRVLNPEKTYTDTGSFDVVLHVRNNNGCTDAFPLTINVNPFYTLVVPSAFTPGGSQGGEYDPNALDNDVFYPFTDFVESYDFQIFNRWGELVFQSNQLNIGWDGYYKGVLAQQDVYVWKLNITYSDGFKISKTGDVTLLRK